MAKTKTKTCTKISELRSSVEAIEAAVTAGSAYTSDAYATVRSDINLLVLDILLGFHSETSKKNPDEVILTSGKMPSAADVAEVSSLLGRLRMVEEVIPLSVATSPAAQAGMALDGSDAQAQATTQATAPQVQRFRLVNNYRFPSPTANSFKAVKAAYYDGTSSAMAYYIGPDEVPEITKVGADLRKKRNIRRGIIIGAISVAAVTGISIIAANACKKESDTEMDEDGVESGNEDILVTLEDSPLDPVDPESLMAIW